MSNTSVDARHPSVATYFKTDNIRSAIVDGLAVIMDLRSGNYVVLDDVATAMWRSLISTRPDARLEMLTQKFDASAEQLLADLDTFAGDCLTRGYLALAPASERTATRNEQTPRADRPSAWKAWLSLLTTSRSLRSNGFPTTYKTYAAYGKPFGEDADTDARVDQAERAFARAENFFVMRTAPKDCLPRSLALYRFMLSVGLPVEHCIGVSRFPFAAHAWVEYRGRILRDSQSFVKHYAKLAVL